MAKTRKAQLNVRVDEGAARAARERALARGVSVNRYIEDLVRQDTGEAGPRLRGRGRPFMRQYETVFAEEAGEGRVRG
ncbi:toxin-antitoxin system HicB family antitoxin [Streptomyces sp. NPDC016675]|uniref:toxin-antitoxin system HicB family antitoxin n=1 Tax=Streptomyces sp. NPDC016675 TaxID=3364970 RepID=UPI0036FDF0E1